jgi:prepilin-type N-terminal cleavage/methylation domain-containing protein
MRRGVTLIETIIAIAVVASTLTAVGALLSAARLGLSTRDESLAYAIASSKLESLRAAGYAALPASGSFSDTQLASLPSGAGSLSVADETETLKQVTVTVGWSERGAARTVSLSTLIASSGGLP